jgi:hypothetical protein
MTPTEDDGKGLTCAISRRYWAGHHQASTSVAASNREQEIRSVLTRINTPIASGIAAFALAFALGGAAVGVALVADTTSPDDENAPAAVDTVATFEDLDANGVDDHCQTEPIEAVPEAEASAAAAAVDLDQDGTISKSEAARSDRIGGKNCNHGGYVSGVAKGDDEDANEEEDAAAECEGATEPAEPAEDEEEAEAPNAHGKAVSEVAKSDAVGGKNCNHGGAVSEAAKGNKPDKADKEAAKAARAEAKAARAEARAARQHGKQP